MDKNVGSVNIDELKAARESLDRERGIETDPNMYNDYDPDKHKAEKEQERLARENVLDDSQEDSIAEENDVDAGAETDSADEKSEESSKSSSSSILDAFEEDSKNENEVISNFDVYDNFSDFEVNSELEEMLDDNQSNNEDNQSDKLEENIAEPQLDNAEDGDSIDDFLSEIDTILSKEDDEEISDSNFSNNNETSKTEDDFSERDSEIDSLEKFSVNSENAANSSETDGLGETEILTDFSKLSEIFEEDETENPTVENKIADDDNAESDSESADKVLEESDEKAGDEYKSIEKFNFIDVISSEEFKEEDRLSYVLGKDENNQVVYSNLRDTCGTAIFARNEEAVFEQFSSILLSLLLKNTPADIQFVILDAMYDSEFDVFNESSYMYLSRVAKNNREIVDSLIEMSKEIENRYNSLVYTGVKSISAYNLQAEERGTSKMPYIVLFVNNYAKMTQFLDADRINVCLHNILKFGRIVGVYAIIASAGEIERNDINYNLPTRISYMVNDAHESVFAIGSEGAENLKDPYDFLYSTVYDEAVRHLKVPSLTQKEIELIIENLEN